MMLKNKEQAREFLDSIKDKSLRPIFCDESFEAQTKFIKDRAKYKAGFCTRRAGKSYGVGLELFNAAYYYPGTSQIYIALTRLSAERIMFKDIYSTLNRAHGLGCEFNKAKLTVEFPNGSVIYNVGMDSTPEEAEKALGQKFKKAVLDEAGSFRRDLRPILYGIIGPALTDLDGTCTVIGTPTSLTKGLFYDIVWAKTEPGWSVHRWSAFDNPYMAEKWQREIDDLTARNPLIVETPYFKQMYLGEYCVDQSQLVYKYNDERNHGDLPNNELIYVLGVDLGFNDPSAFVVCGYNVHDTSLYVIESFKRSQMTISDVAERIKYYQKRFNPYKIVIDNANKQAVEEIKQRYELPIVAADKAGKAEFIEIMNSELILGKIKLCPNNELLEEEWKNLIWDERSEKREEHSACDNHLADACLYAWRHCYQYLSRPKEKAKTAEDKLDIWFDRESEKVMNKVEQPFWERD